MTSETSEAGSSQAAARPPTLSTEASTNRLRPWKASRSSSTSQTQKDKRLSKSWEKRVSERKEAEATKKLERELKEEKEAEIERRRNATKERQTKLAEKRRLEELAKKVSAKKLQRMKKRLNRSKKVSA